MFHFIGSVTPTAMANGLALMTSVYYSAKVSGAHLNPAVTTVFSIMGFTHPVEAVLYIVSQVLGCVTGALLIALVIPNSKIGGIPPIDHALGCFVPKAGLTNANIVAWETIGTIMFIVPVMSVVWYTQNKQGYGNTGPIMVGISLIASALAVGGWTGASFNPARSLGSAIVFDCSQGRTLGAYVGGQMLGAFLAPLIIIPWYGISNQSWFMAYIPPNLKQWLRVLSPLIELKTLDKAEASEIVR